KRCQSFRSASVMSRRKRREFSSAVVGSGGLTVVTSPDPHPNPLPGGEGAKSASLRAWWLAAVVGRSHFRRALTPPRPGGEREPTARDCGRGGWQRWLDYRHFAVPSPQPPPGGRGSQEQNHALQHAALHLVAFDALEQGLEVALA